MLGVLRRSGIAEAQLPVGRRVTVEQLKHALALHEVDCTFNYLKDTSTGHVSPVDPLTGYFREHLRPLGSYFLNLSFGEGGESAAAHAAAASRSAAQQTNAAFARSSYAPSPGYRSGAAGAHSAGGTMPKKASKKKAAKAAADKSADNSNVSTGDDDPAAHAATFEEEWPVSMLIKTVRLNHAKDASQGATIPISFLRKVAIAVNERNPDHALRGSDTITAHSFLVAVRSPQYLQHHVMDGKWMEFYFFDSTNQTTMKRLGEADEDGNFVLKLNEAQLRYYALDSA